MWYASCSSGAHWIPSTVTPGVVVEAGASCRPVSSGIPSGPSPWAVLVDAVTVAPVFVEVVASVAVGVGGGGGRSVRLRGDRWARGRGGRCTTAGEGHRGDREARDQERCFGGLTHSAGVLRRTYGVGPWSDATSRFGPIALPAAPAAAEQAQQQQEHVEDVEEDAGCDRHRAGVFPSAGEAVEVECREAGKDHQHQDAVDDVRARDR